MLRHRHEQIDVLQQMRNGRLQQQGGQGQVLVTPFRRFDIVEPVTQQGPFVPDAGLYTYLLVAGVSRVKVFGRAVAMLEAVDAEGERHVLRTDEVAPVQEAGQYNV